MPVPPSCSQPTLLHNWNSFVYRTSPAKFQSHCCLPGRVCGPLGSYEFSRCVSYSGSLRWYLDFLFFPQLGWALALCKAFPNFLLLFSFWGLILVPPIPSCGLKSCSHRLLIQTTHTPVLLLRYTCRSLTEENF